MTAKDKKSLNNEDKLQHGGARAGSGRKAIFMEPTTISFKTELKLKERLKNKYGKELNVMVNEWFQSLDNDK